MRNFPAIALLFLSPAGFARDAPDTDPGYEALPATAFALREKIVSRAVAPEKLAGLKLADIWEHDQEHGEEMTQGGLTLRWRVPLGL